VLSDKNDQKQVENLNIETTTILNEVDQINSSDAKNNFSNSSVISDEVDQKQDDQLDIESTTILNEVDQIKVENLEFESTTVLNEDKGTFFKYFYFTKK
jgi:hypothetical protein